VTDLSQANNDMNNLLAGTGIGTIFVDHKLRILRFTPSALQIINLIQSDVGRPVGHIVSKLVGYDRLMVDAQSVLDTLVSREVNVQTTAGTWYRMSIQPYRTLDNVIEGAVITFLDITEIRRIEVTLKRSELLLYTIQQLTHVGGWEWDIEKQTMFWTEETYRLYDLKPGELLPGPAGMTQSLECYLPEDRLIIQTAFQRCIEEGQSYDLAVHFTTARKRHLWVRTSANPILENKKIVRIVGFIMDITDRQPPSPANINAEKNRRNNEGVAQ
jgi:two-component system CheB/CheR fusion protein